MSKLSLNPNAKSWEPTFATPAIVPVPPQTQPTQNIQTNQTNNEGTNGNGTVQNHSTVPTTPAVVNINFQPSNNQPAATTTSNTPLKGLNVNAAAFVPNFNAPSFVPKGSTGSEALNSAETNSSQVTTPATTSVEPASQPQDNTTTVNGPANGTTQDAELETSSTVDNNNLTSATVPNSDTTNTSNDTIDSTTATSETEVVDSIRNVNLTNHDESWNRNKSLNTPNIVFTPTPSAQPSNPAPNQQSSWKRGIVMVEKTVAQMLMRADGIKRYSKDLLFSLNVKGKQCPPNLREAFGKRLCEIERHLNKGKGDYHPDEELIFGTVRENTFRFNPNASVNKTDPEYIVRQGKLILNKLSVEKFDKLSQEFITLLKETEGWELQPLMEKAVDLVVTMAQEYETQCFLFADLCKVLIDHWIEEEKRQSKDSNGDTAPEAAAEGEGEGDKSDAKSAYGKLFKTTLLTRCQHEFERDREEEYKTIENNANLSNDEKSEELFIIKKKYLAFIRFVGEIYRKDLISNQIMKQCVEELLETTEEDKLMCLCKLLSTVGKKLEEYDQRKKRASMKEFLAKMTAMSEDKNLPARVRFAFKDILEMQRKGWLARREEEKAKKLSEFRQEGLSISVSAGNLNTMAPSPKTGGNTPGPHKGRGSQDARNYNDGNNSPSLNQPKSPSGEWQDVRKSERGGAKKGSSLAGGPPTAGKMRGSQSMSQLNDGKTIPNARKTQDARGRPQSTTLLSKQAAANNDSASKPPLQKENSSTSVESEPIDIAEDVEFAEISLPGDVKSRMRGQVNEYLATSMENEFAEVFSSLLTKENAASLVKEFFVIAVDLKESEREKLWHLLPFLYTSKNLTSAAIITGVTFFVNVLEDLICDAPKANIYLASLLAPLCVEAEGAAFSGSLGFILKATYERPEEIILPTVAQVEKTHAELAQQIYKNTIASASDEQKEALRQVAEKFSCQTAIGLL